MAQPIVVGFDGSDASLHAAAWAGHEAEMRGARVHIVQALTRWPDVIPLVPEPAEWELDAESVASEGLKQAAIRVRAGHPRLEVTVGLVVAEPVDGLLQAAQDAQLLVVGSRGRGGFTGLLLGSVSRSLAVRAPCPVAVVRQPPVDQRGVVVVGVTGQPGQEAVLDFAFHEAGMREATLCAVHAWRHPAGGFPGDMRPLVYDAETVGREEAVILGQVLAGWRENHPDVEVVQRVVHEHPAAALIAASAEADLIILGAHRAPRLLRDLGGTAHAVLHHSRVPVIVVRP